MIELEDFRTVVAVVDSGGINKAAQLLHRVPSALSMRLQNLENRLGITLFEKQGRNIIPTAYALELAEDGRKILSSVRTAESRLVKRLPGGLLRLGATDSLAGTRLAGPISELIHRYPSIKLELKVGSSEQISKSILEREIDAGLMITHTYHDEFRTVALFPEKLILIASKTHRPVLTPKDIEHDTVLAFHIAGTHHDQCLEWFHEAGMTPARVIELPSYSAILGTVAAGLGVSVVPLHWIEYFHCIDTVSVHQLPRTLSEVRVDFVHLKHTQSPNLKALESILLELKTL